jgi:hypothetical protein
MAAYGDEDLGTYMDGWFAGFQAARESTFYAPPPSSPSLPSAHPPDSKKDTEHKKDAKSKKDKKDKKGKKDMKTDKKSKKSTNDKYTCLVCQNVCKKYKTNEKDRLDHEDLEHLLPTVANRTQSEEQALEDEILQQILEDDHAYQNRVAQGLQEPAR